MTTSPLQNLLITVIAVVIAAAGIYYYSHATPTGTGSATTSTAATTTSTTIGGVTITGPGSVTVEPVMGPAAPKAPAYNQPLVFSASLDTDARAALTSQLAKTMVVLDKDPLNFDTWINLGTIRKIAGDYAGAAVVWEYVSAKWPGNIVSYSNLGDLYMNFLKDYPKAEANYKAEIQYNPKDIDAYRNLFNLYTVYGYKRGTGADKAIIELGLKNNPGNPDLTALQAQK